MYDGLVLDPIILHIFSSSQTNLFLEHILSTNKQLYFDVAAISFDVLISASVALE